MDVSGLKSLAVFGLKFVSEAASGFHVGFTWVCVKTERPSVTQSFAHLALSRFSACNEI